MQKAIRPYESSSWTTTVPGNSIFRPKTEDKPSSSTSLAWLTSPKPKPTSINAKRSSNHLVVMENAVVVFARRGCCMGHVAKRLLLTHGVNPLVVEIGEDEEDNKYDNILSDKEKLPVMYIGGKLFGGLENLMAAHINGDLVPSLRQAGALWL
ncbi:PREDICTED: monothiol glutaredoxin-S13-like [Camelina sativa]|uniref:Monothiol glutaredoxin-S13-like n=1 Tax=Camelina sativa TaxID=90675 RepID=A0ABM0WR81_CAMSA|nr:PREDICTED: monothiol glutaredoxin-S13-like [Camelina sativa]